MQIKAVVIRLWWDEDGRLTGHVSDPATGQRVPFRHAAELWRALERAAAADPTPPPDALPSGEDIP